MRTPRGTRARRKRAAPIMPIVFTGILLAIAGGILYVHGRPADDPIDQPDEAIEEPAAAPRRLEPQEPPAAAPAPEPEPTLAATTSTEPATEPDIAPPPPAPAPAPPPAPEQATPPAQPVAEAPTEEPGWRIVWADEFDTPGLPDPKKWGYEEGFVRNGELQYYMKARKKNSRVEDGMLVIEAHRERIPNPGYNPNGTGGNAWKSKRQYAEYTAAALETRHTASWTYGKIEVRAKLPTGRGTWPAIWMLGTNISRAGWPKCGEIDIMENVGYDPDIVHTTLHTAGYNHMKGNGRGHGERADRPYERFHVYGMEWTENAISFFLDGRKTFSVANDGTGVDAWPFFEPQYLILNFAVGGGWGGQKGVDQSIWPQRFLIDYVRVYERTGVAYRDATEVTGAEPGLTCSAYEGTFSALPDFTKLRPVKRSTVSTIDLSQRTRDDHFALTFEGYIRAPEDAAYAFFTESDDGSSLYIGDELVVQNDGLHGMKQVGGEIHLRAGLHPIRIEYFEQGGGEGLSAGWRWGSHRIAPLPAAALFHGGRIARLRPTPARATPDRTDDAPSADRTPTLDIAYAGTESVRLTWEPDRIRGVELARRDGPDARWRVIATLPAGIGSYRDTNGVLPGRDYTYRARYTRAKETPVQRGGAKAAPFSLDLVGATRLVLSTTDGGDGNGYDHGYWGSPTLITPDHRRVKLSSLTPTHARVGWEEPRPPEDVRIGSHTYPDSIYAHAPGRFEYDLGGAYVRFEARVGIASHVGRQGTVAFLAEAIGGGSVFSEGIDVTTATPLQSPGHRTYYVDAEQGDDRAAGTAPDQAWKSAQKINDTILAPGDRVLLAGGQTFAGPVSLDAQDAGDEDARITIASYGNGRAIIDGGTGNGVVLDGCSFVTIENLAVVGAGRKNGSDGSGIHIRRTTDVHIDTIDVSGFRVTGINAGGDARLRVTRVHAHDNGSAGISVNGGYGDLPRSTDVYIGHCLAENNPGDPKNLTNHSGNGIVVGGLDGARIEYCEFRENGWDMPRKGNGPVGIWAWNASRVVIQYCVSHDNKTQKGAMDGGGFDFDGGVTDSVLQYNLSFNNHGSGYLLCQYPKAARWKDNICRYNISINDGLTNHFAGIHFWKGAANISDAQVHNNLVVNRRNAVSSGEKIDGLVFRNNVFISGAEVIAGPFSSARFEHNIYHSTGNAAIFRGDGATYASLEEWANATGQEMQGGLLTGLQGDPKLLVPEGIAGLPTSPDELATMLFGRALDGSPVVGSGTSIEDNGGRDFYGNAIGGDGPKNIGPFEGPALSAEDSRVALEAVRHAPPPGYTLAWADEFDRDGPPDPANWTFEHGFVRNKEFQYYQQDNARCENGILVIEGRREKRKNERYKAGSTNWKENRAFAEYTAASMKTAGLHSWTYGRFEMRARIPTAPGLWPAFWTLGSAREWPSCGEVDIMEYYRGTLLANLAWGTKKRWTPKWSSTKTPVSKLGGPGWADRFHVWRMDWDHDFIRLYVDDTLLNETALSRTFNGSDDRANPFREPHYILVNLAIGGNAGGDPSTTQFPVRYEIDYIRVYRRAE